MSNPPARASVPPTGYYRLGRNLPAVAVELYVPDHAIPLPALRGVLNEALDREQVRRFFRDLVDSTPGRQEAAKKFAEDCWTAVQRSPVPTRREVEAFPQLLDAYTIHAAQQVAAGGGPEPGLTHVVRMTFRYPCQDSSFLTINYAKAILRDPLSEVGPFEENYRDLAARMPPETRRDIEGLHLWMRQLGWFLNNYLIYRLSRLLPPGPPGDCRPALRVEAWWNVNVGLVEWQQPARRGRNELQ